MAVNESIGGVVVSIGGDFSPLMADAKNLQGAAQAAGEAVGSSIAAGATQASGATDQLSASIERLILITQQESAAQSLALQRNLSGLKSTGQAVRALGEEATGAGFSFRYAFFGVKDLMEGRVKFAVAEAANELVRLGPQAIAAGVAIGAIGYAAYKLGDAAGLWHVVTEEEKKAAEEAAKYEKELRAIYEQTAQLKAQQFELKFGAVASGGAGLAAGQSDAQVKHQQVEETLAQVGAKRREIETTNEAISATDEDAASKLAYLGVLSRQKAELKDLTETLGKLRAEEENLKQAASTGATVLIGKLLDQSQKQRNEQTEADNEAARERQKNYETQLRVMGEIARAHQEASRTFVEGEKDKTQALKEATKYLNEQYAALVKGDEQAAERDKQTAEMHKKFVDEMLLEEKKLYEPRPDIAQIPINVSLEQRLGGTAVGRNISLRSQGVETQAALQSQIGQMEQLLALEQAANIPLEERVRLQRAIAQAQITQRSGAAAGRLYGDIAGAGQQLPGAVGGALAKGIIDGKGIGKDIRESLKGIGQEMLGSVFKELISSILLNTAATGTLSLSTIGNTIATEANTVWLAIKSLFGFAGGTDFAPGGPALVGERGPEIVNLPRGSQVIPNHMLKGYADGAGLSTVAIGGGGNISIQNLSVHAHGITDPSKFTEHVFRTIPKVAKSRTSSQSPYSR